MARSSSNTASWSGSFVARLFAAACALVATAPASSYADPTCPAMPSTPPPRQAIVRVDAIEHFTYGAVVEAPNIVVVPYHAIEVDKIGGTHAGVYDSDGVRHRASIYAIDRGRGLAFLRTDEPIADPFAVEPTRAADKDECTYLLRGSIPDGRIGEYPWAPNQKGSPVSIADGTPVVDAQGRLVGIFAEGFFERGGLIPNASIDAAASNRQPEQAAARRSFIYYGGITIAQAEFATSGGLWWGGRGSFATRYRDLLEGRLDLGFTLLTGKPRTGNACAEPPCSEGIRGSLTPSFGLHLRLGSFAHDYESPIVLTPSIGWAFVAQYVQKSSRTVAFDEKSPGFFHTFAPGIAFSISYFELAFRMRMPRDEVRSATYELSFGAVF